MTALILTIAQLAGKILVDQLQKRGKDTAADYVSESITAARDIITALAANASTATNGELTADDVHNAVRAAMAEVDALIADAEASLRSRQTPPPPDGQ